MGLKPEKLIDFLGSDKGRRIIVIVGTAVILLLFLSTLSFGKSEDTAETAAQAENAAEIEQELEQRLERLISQIPGAGNVTVMVTLESTSERVYAEQTHTESSSSENGESSSQSRTSETELAFSGSSKEPIELSVIQPKVRGAAVVCSGASDPVVREKIANVVSGVLDIGVSKVCVTG